MRILILCVWIVAIGGALALIGADLLSCGWWAEIFQHPRLQIACGMLLAAGVAAGCRRWRLAGLGLGLFIWALAALVPPIMGRERVAPAGGLRIAVANVHSDNPDPAAAIAAVLALHADVVGIIEPTPAWEAALAPLRARYPVRHEILREDNFGLCLYARAATNGRTARVTTWWPESADVPCLTVELDGVDLLLAHPLPPLSAEYHVAWRRQLAAVVGWARAHPRGVVCGDLNATPWSAGWRQLCRDGGLHGPGGMIALAPTWMVGTCFMLPIDHVLAGTGLVFSSYRIAGAIGSDHRPVVAELQLR